MPDSEKIRNMGGEIDLERIPDRVLCFLKEYKRDEQGYWRYTND